MKQLLTFFAAWLLVSSTAAQSTELKTVQISIFKDGSSFVLKRGKVATPNGKFRLAEVDIPPALFGTFWFQNLDLKQVVSSVDSMEQTITATVQTLFDLLKANTGQTVGIYLIGPKAELVSGKVEAVYENSPKVLLIKPSLNQFLVEIKQSNGKWLTLRSSEIDRIEFDSKPNNTLTSKVYKVENSISIDFEGNKTEQDLDMMYLQKGLAWYPQYQIEVLSKSTARLQLMAEVVNENQDIVQTDVNVVVGVPNFRYAIQKSMLTSFLDHIFGQYGGNYNNISQTQVVARNMQLPQNGAYNYGATSPEDNSAINIEPTAVGDLFFYPIKNMSLKKGASGQFDLFSYEIPVSDVYECNLQNNAGLTDIRQTYHFQQPERTTVFHSLRLSNSTPTPWTSAPAIIVKTEKGVKLPLGQDLLNFTSKKAVSFIKITETPEIIIDQTEKEIGRQNNVRSSYDLVTIECSVSIKNYKIEDVQMNIRRLLYGDLVSTEIPWEAESILVPEINRINYAVNNVLWDFVLKKGDDKTFKYVYKILVWNPN